MRSDRLAAFAVLILVWPASASLAARAIDPLTLISDPAVQAALDEAGPNRGEILDFLAGAAASGDAEKAEAARFLVANMPGKGFVAFTLRDEQGEEIAFDALQLPTYARVRERIDEIERRRGTVDFVRGDLVPDLRTLTAEFLTRHLELAFEVWRGTPAARRPDFATFCEFVLPYRGSNEPAEDWLSPLANRLAPVQARLGADAGPAEAWSAVNAEAQAAIRFDERYYLHPTDQGFSDMEAGRMGRCEDIANRTTYGARALGVAIATDYTPAWAHSDNNHAWTVLLDPEGRGTDPVGRKAAKVYRKTFSRRPDSLAFQLPEGREAPNRWIAAACQYDVTDQYGPTTDVTVEVDPARAGDEQLAYLCVFNGGRWVALQFGRIEDGRVAFAKMGRDVLYLPAVHDGERLIAIAPPLLLEGDGTVRSLPGEGPSVALAADDVRPHGASAETPASRLTAGTAYTLSRWTDGHWATVAELDAGTEPLRFAELPADGLYWLVAEGSRRLERPFEISAGRQRFW